MKGKIYRAENGNNNKAYEKLVGEPFWRDKSISEAVNFLEDILDTKLEEAK